MLCVLDYHRLISPMGEGNCLHRLQKRSFVVSPYAKKTIMTGMQERIFKVFKEFKVSRNGVIDSHSLDKTIKKWGTGSRDGEDKAIDELIALAYLSFDNDWYTLLAKGYDHIYAGYSIGDTELLILGEFKARKISPGHRLMRDSLSPFQHSLERFHMDNFNTALLNLISIGFLVKEERGYILTQNGYDKIYA